LRTHLGPAASRLQTRHDGYRLDLAADELDLAQARTLLATARAAPADALAVLQRAELVTRMAVEVERYIVELGTEGRLIEMQLEETVMGVMSERAALARDYIAVDSERELERTVADLAAG